MQWYKHLAVAICVLLIIDGSVCLIFHEKIDGWVKKFLPGLNILLIASLEVIVAGVALFLLLRGA